MSTKEEASFSVPPPPASEEREPGEPVISTILRVIVHATTASVIAWPLTVDGGVLAAALGAALGSLVARFVAATRVRLYALLFLCAGCFVGVGLLRTLIVDGIEVAASLGPSGTAHLGDAVLFGLGALVVSVALRSVSARIKAFSILEAAVIAFGFATLLVAHRNGAIHRPYFLADPLIQQGQDPTIALLAVGLVGAVVIALHLLAERSLWRSAFHLVVMAGLLLLIFITTSYEGLPSPENAGGALGLSDDDSESGGGGGAGGQRGDENSDELQFRDEYRGGGNAPDAVIVFHDDYSPPGGYYYFRQNAFSQYNGRKLVAATRADLDRDVRNLFPSGRASEVAWSPRAGELRADVETTVALMADNSAPLGLEAPTHFVPSTNQNPERFRRMYRVRSVSLTADLLTLLERQAGDPDWPDDVRDHYLELPADPRYQELANEIVSQLPPHLAEQPVARAFAITQYLGQHGTYSLRSRHAGAEDPTADFLFGDLTGYCVHFSHAAVFLMRAVGVPARVGTGYAVAEANRQGGSALLLRGGDQHAWPEIFLGPAEGAVSNETEAIDAFLTAMDNGQTAIFPLLFADTVMEEVATAVQEAYGPSAAAEAERMTHLPMVTGSDVLLAVETVSEDLGKTSRQILMLAAYAAQERARAQRVGWVVVDVSPAQVLDPPGEPPDPQLQRLLGELARGSTPIDDIQPPTSARAFARDVGVGTLWLVGSVFLLAIVFLYGERVRRWAVARLLRRPALIYRAVLDSLSANGLRRRWGESPEAFADRLRRELPTFGALTNSHLRVAFGAASASEPNDDMLGTAREVGRELRKAVPLWRRALGAFHPFSWILTR